MDATNATRSPRALPGQFLKGATTTAKGTCTAKKTSCGTTEKWAAGTDSDKTKDDTTCTPCDDGEYKSSNTACSAKKTSCGSTDKFTAVPGKTQDNTCTPCGDGEYKSSNTVCSAKKTSCGTTEKFKAVPGKTQDNTCTPCGDGEYKSSMAECHGGRGAQNPGPPSLGGRRPRTGRQPPHG